MFDEVTEYRRIVEPGIAEIAAVRHTSEQLDRLKIIACDQQRRLLVGENDGDLDARFHLALAECTGNKLLIDTVARLNRIYAKGRTPELRDTPWRSSRFPPTCASSTRLSGGPRKTAARPSKSISIRLSTNTFSPP